MGKRPGRVYREPQRPWTRTAVRKPHKAYVKGVRNPVIRLFNMGSKKKGECNIRVDLLADRKMQIRDEAIEAARVNANKSMVNKVGKENYAFKIRVYPHQCLRKNAMAMGAGADRISSGMRLSFGRPCGRAAIVNKNQKIMSIWTTEEHKEMARKALKKANSKLPGSNDVRVEEVENVAE